MMTDDIDDFDGVNCDPDPDATAALDHLLGYSEEDSHDDRLDEGYATSDGLDDWDDDEWGTTTSTSSPTLDHPALDRPAGYIPHDQRHPLFPVCKDSPSRYTEAGLESLLWTLFQVERRLTEDDIKAYYDAMPSPLITKILRKMEREGVVTHRYGKWEYTYGKH